MNNINKIQIVSTQNHTETNKELTDAHKSPVGETIKKVNNKKVKQTNILKNTEDIKSIIHKVHNTYQINQ